MKVLQEFSDKTAIGLSMICLVHCLVLPSFLIILSGYFTLSYDNELVHYMLLLIAIPLSFYALINGVRNHSSFIYLVTGMAGIISLIFAVTMGVDLWDESGEIVFTIIGASLVSFSHYKNYKLCREAECDSCH
tara:strand:+ start:210 stop:608 length:399 start_codon:yes stop_codon:yes gene_type:complete